MKAEIKYIELKSNFSHNGPAWIGLVSFSKSGRTIYFDGKAFQRVGSDRMLGNYYDIESGEEYWISGFKNDMTDRHRFGKGLIKVEERILEEYLLKTKQKELDKTKFSVCRVNEEIPKNRIKELENEVYENDTEINHDRGFINPSELNSAELEYFINYFNEASIDGKFLKGRKFSRAKRDQLIAEKEKREKILMEDCK